MKEVLEIIIKNLVEDKEAIEINENIEEKNVTYKVKVAQSDMGKIIGRQGKLAKSIRTLIKAVASKEQKKVTIEFIG